MIKFSVLYQYLAESQIETSTILDGFHTHFLLLEKTENCYGCTQKADQLFSMFFFFDSDL